MSNCSEFIKFKEAYNKTNFQEYEKLSRQEVKEVICADCEFYKPEEPDELECGAFKIITTLLDKGVIDLEQIARALEK